MTVWSSIGGFSDIGVVHPSVTLTDKMRLIDAMAVVKPRYVRTICAWNYITKTRDPGAAVASPPSYGFAPNVYTPPTTTNRDWSSLDTIVNEILRRIPGVRPQLIIGQGKPKWSGFVGAPNYSDYGNFCVEVVNRYGPGGLGIAPDLRSAGRCVLDYEIWNEQNNKGFWTWGNVNPKGYVQMITDAYGKIKAAQPLATVVFGSYQHVSRTGPWYGYGWITQPEIEWWQECFDNGLGNVFDVVGVHPYSIGDYEYGLGPIEPSLTLSDAWLQFQELRDLLVSKGYGDKPWRITEIGYPTSMCTEAQQVQFHQESMGFMADFPFVEAYMIYCCRNDGTDLKDKEQSLGAMYNDFTPKQLYYFLQAQNGVVVQAPPMLAHTNTSSPTVHQDVTVNAVPMTATAEVADTRVLTNVLVAPAARATSAVVAPTVHLSSSVTTTAMNAATSWPACFVLVDNPPPIHNVVLDDYGPGALTENTGSASQLFDIPASMLGGYLLVGMVISHSFQIGYAGLTIGATVGGVAMTPLGATDIGGFKEGSVHWFGKANPASGTGVSIAVSATGVSIKGIMMCPVLLEGVLGIGEIVTNKSQNFWTVSADVTTGVNDRAFLLVGGGKQVTSSTGTILYNDGDADIPGQGSFMMLATAPSDGDGSTNITATQGSAPYGMVGIQVKFDPSLAVIQMQPLAMTAAAAVSVPAVQTSDTVTGVHFAASAAVVPPAVSTNYTVVAPPMTATATVRNPVVNLTINAPPMTATAAVVAPAASTSGTVNAVHFAATAAAAAPVISSANIVAPPAFAATAAMAAPVVQNSITITAVPFTATALVTNPAVASGLVIAPPAMVATAASAAPVVSSSVTITAPPMTATAASVAPALSSSSTVTGVHFAATAASAAPVVSTSGAINAVAFAATAASAAPAVSTNYSVTGVAFAATAAVAAPVVSVPSSITINAVPCTATAAAAAPVLKIAYDLPFSGSTLPTSGPTAQPTVVGHAAASGNTVAVPTHQAGDCIFYAAFRDGSTTLPSTDANYISYKTQTGTLCAMRVSVRKAVSSSEPAGTFTNATEVICVVIRGADNGLQTSTATGSKEQDVAAGGSGTGGTITYPAATLLYTNSTSAILRFAGQRDPTNMTTNAPTGYSQVDGVSTGICAVLSNSNAAANPTADTQSTNGTLGWCAITCEIAAATTSFGNCIPVSVSSSTMREGPSGDNTDGDYYEAWLHPSPMNTDVYTARANSGALVSGSTRGIGACVGVPDNTAPVTKALIGIGNQQTAAGWAILTWDGSTWTTRASATGTGTSSGTADDIGIRISKSGGIYTYTLQKNQVDTSLSWTDSTNAFGTPGPRWGAAFHHIRNAGTQGGSPGVDEIWSADT